MNFPTLFDTLKEHEMEMKRLVDDEKDDNKKKTSTLKTEEKIL